MPSFELCLAFVRLCISLNEPQTKNTPKNRLQRRLDERTLGASFPKERLSFSSPQLTVQFFRSRAPPSYPHTSPSCTPHCQKCLSSFKEKPKRRRYSPLVREWITLSYSSDALSLFDFSYSVGCKVSFGDNCLLSAKRKNRNERNICDVINRKLTRLV